MERPQLLRIRNKRVSTLLECVGPYFVKINFLSKYNVHRAKVHRLMSTQQTPRSMGGFATLERSESGSWPLRISQSAKEKDA